jgi:hypothetical protein
VHPNVCLGFHDAANQRSFALAVEYQVAADQVVGDLCCVTKEEGTSKGNQPI